MNKYISVFFLAALSGTAINAQTLKQAPRLVVNIAIDQLRNDYIEQFSPFYSPNGFKKLLGKGRVYESAEYSFSPVDQASAIATIATGTSPEYHHIISEQWVSRKTLLPVFCVDDSKHGSSPSMMASSTITDELKVSTNGAAIVFGIAADKEAAILSAGHAADGALWIDEHTNAWRTSSYYPGKTNKQLRAFANLRPRPHKEKALANDDVVNASLDFINNNAMGVDENTDYLAITLSAGSDHSKRIKNEMERIYLGLDKNLSKLISRIEQNIGAKHVLFILTSTGYSQEPEIDFKKYRIPTGTLNVKRTANLLNMYLGAVYGEHRYIDTFYRNQIYLDHNLLEQKHLSLTEIKTRSRDFLTQLSGVHDVHDGNYDTSICGDLIIEAAPGWKVYNEDTGNYYYSRAAFVPFPIIFYGTGVEPKRIYQRVTTDRIAPTIAKSIQIRAPNACKVAPLP